VLEKRNDDSLPSRLPAWSAVLLQQSLILADGIYCRENNYGAAYITPDPIKFDLNPTRRKYISIDKTRAGCVRESRSKKLSRIFANCAEIHPFD